MEFRAQCLGFRVKVGDQKPLQLRGQVPLLAATPASSHLGVDSFRFMVLGLWFWVLDFRFGVLGYELMVLGLGLRSEASGSGSSSGITKICRLAFGV